MSYKPAPTDMNGLVKPPRMRDCVGESCPIAAKRGACFTDWHHLYWPFDKFVTTSPLVKEFHDDRHNLLPIARCRHNSERSTSYHSRYDYAAIPPSDTMQTFLDESSVLYDLGITVKNMARIVRSLTTTNIREKAYNPSRSLDWFLTYEDRLHGINKQIKRFEIVPSVVVTEVLQRQEPSLQAVELAGFGALTLATAPQLITDGLSTAA